MSSLDEKKKNAGFFAMNIEVASAMNEIINHRYELAACGVNTFRNRQSSAPLTGPPLF